MNTIRYFLALALAACSFSLAADDAPIKPFVLASTSTASLEARTAEVLDALTAAGFEIAGQYSPMDDTNIIVVTSDALQSAAAASELGGYGAGQRVSVARNGEEVETGFVNPVYIQHAYRMQADLVPVFELLAATLGQEQLCGADGEKMTPKKLADYNYMIGMQKFDDSSELGSFTSHAEAVAAVERGLAREGDGLTQVYRIDIPGKEQTVFGVGMRATSEEEEHIDEGYQMSIVDFEGCRKPAYLPYEVLVNGKDVQALHMRFRMAVHFPNLSMMGKHGFTKLMPFPGAIEDALSGMLGGD